MTKKRWWVDIACFDIEADNRDEAEKEALERMKAGQGEVCHIELQDSGKLE
jgi:hypothetical protein|tara:strand:- start:10740 stop:10892 length:153 start_codon:yes stop_codon:yes gene_type:complete